MNEEILHRSDSVLTDVNVKLRLIELIAVPWEQEAEVIWRGEKWREVFGRNAFNGLEDHAGRIIVNREHKKGDTIGKVVSVDTKDTRGLLTRVKVASTPRGDETLALADEDMLGPSIGYFVKLPTDVDLNKQTRLRRVKRGFLDHLSMVESPTWEGARVLAVRAESQTGAGYEPLPATPNLDAIMSDEAIMSVLRKYQV